MNVTAHQKKENMNTDRREAEEKWQATDFKETECSPSAVVQRAAQRKKGLDEGRARGNWNPLED